MVGALGSLPLMFRAEYLDSLPAFQELNPSGQSLVYRALVALRIS